MSSPAATVTYLDDHAKERSTFAIPISFTDETGAAVTPNEATWTLTDVDGFIVDDRVDETITPAESVDIVLSGDDLALPANKTNERVVLVEWTFDSDLGTNLPAKQEVHFYIDGLTAIKKRRA
jgi:hypothetical protein